jgi:hypothetical protein
LRFYATGTFQLVATHIETFAVSKPTVCRVVHTVTAAIASLCAKYILFPATAKEKRDVMNQFFMTSRLPGVLGAIDCTHIAIQSPGGNEAEVFQNWKGYFSVNVQLVCDRGCYITDVVAPWPGSVHNSTIFDSSHVRAILETRPAECYLVRDGGYACRSYLLTTLSDPGTDAERAFN